MNDIVIKYRLSWREYRRMVWTADPKRHSFLVLLFLIAGAIIAIAGDDVEWRITALIFGFGFPAMMFWISPKINWSNKLSASSQKTITINDERIVFDSVSSETRLTWPQVNRVRETRDYFILHASKPNGAFFVPKRALASGADELNLRSLFKSHVNSTA